MPSLTDLSLIQPSLDDLVFLRQLLAINAMCTPSLRNVHKQAAKSKIAEYRTLGNFSQLLTFTLEIFGKRNFQEPAMLTTISYS